MQIPTLIGGLVILSVLVACAETPLAPVDDRTASSASAISGNLPASSREPIVTQLSLGSPYTVRRGDTLYSIAFRLGIDFKSLARRNAIVAPYTIFPGQVLATDPQRAKPQASLAKVEKEAVETGKILSPIQRPSSSNSKPLASKSAASATGRTHPDVRWLWPSAGKIVRKFAPPRQKGIDIAGVQGAPVRAVASGSVVYVGTGVTGYGAMVIVKHNDQYLSAYGHNEALLVNEGEVVSAGQPIARMGSSGTDSVKLHFEIRKNGKPVDPLGLLPGR